MAREYVMGFEGVQGSLFDSSGENIEELCSYLMRGGIAEIAEETRPLRRDVPKRPGPNYAWFLEQHRGRQIPEDIGEWTDTKRDLLVKFSSRFRKGGSNDLEDRDYANAQIGAMYMGVLRQALKEESKKMAGAKR